MDIPDSSKEYFWCAKLDKKNKVNQWEGRDDGVLEQLVLKRACIAAGAKQGERNLIEVTSFNHKQEKVEACICSLRGGAQEDVALADLTIFPPAIFKLIEGNGPVHIVGNHMMMDDSDEDSEGDQDYFSEEEEGSDISAEDSEEEKALEEVIANGKDKKKPAPKALGKKPKVEIKKVEEDDEEDEEEDEMDDEDMDDLIDGEAADDEEDEEEEEEEEEEVKPVPVSKKRKLANKEGNENKKPATDGSPQKKKKASVEADQPKTPLQQKENKAPASAKKTPKTPAKVYETVDEVKAAIKKYPGGKPRKEDKFGNWVKSAFKVKNDEWITELWKAHKKDLGL
uniref:Nucleoplasmin core domain-containing protein n=1 Tax=Ciona savignyi TaxID=51511 RepID=H2ZNA0_CIOSA